MEEKRRILFDTNIFDEIDLEPLPYTENPKYEFYTTDISLNEIAAIPDSKKGKRKRLHKIIADLKNNGLTVLSSNHLHSNCPCPDIIAYEKIKVCGGVGENDAQIGSIAATGYTLVTNDKRFGKAMEKNGLDVMTYQNLCDEMRSDMHTCNMAVMADNAAILG